MGKNLCNTKRRLYTADTRRIQEKLRCFLTKMFVRDFYFAIKKRLRRESFRAGI